MSQLILGLDVCVPLRVVDQLQNRHIVCILARHAEADEAWFARARAAHAAAMIAHDRDIEILCYDHRVPFVWWRPTMKVTELLTRVTIAIAQGG